jgi:hypothetical protein
MKTLVAAVSRHIQAMSHQDDTNASITVTPKFTEPLLRHFVNLMCVDSGPAAKASNDDQPLLLNFSGFVVEIEGVWLIVTAAHVFEELREAVRHGALIGSWRLDDSSVSAQPQPPLPFHLDIDEGVFLLGEDAQDGMDYACFVVDWLTKEAMIRQGIVAIDIDVWGGDDHCQFGEWLLVGTPAHAVSVGPSTCTKTHVTVRVEYCNEVPPGFEDKAFRRLFAKVDLTSLPGEVATFDVVGMSGGPIFGLEDVIQHARAGSASYRYKLIGIQSAWNRREHIAFCAAQPFFEALRQQIAALRGTGRLPAIVPPISPDA